MQNFDLHASHRVEAEDLLEKEVYNLKDHVSQSDYISPWTIIIDLSKITYKNTTNAAALF